MKKLLVLLLGSLLLWSCGDQSHSYTLKLPNGALLPVYSVSENPIEYQPGTKVCVRKAIGRPSDWYICTDGDLIDTTYITTIQSDSSVYITEHKVGVITKVK